MQKILNSSNKGPIEQSTFRTILNSNNEQEIQKAVNDFMNSKPYKPVETIPSNYSNQPNIMNNAGPNNQPIRNQASDPNAANINKNGKKSSVCTVI